MCINAPPAARTPNKAVLEVNRSFREEKSYTIVHLENEYLDVLVLPETGGRIFAARDKTTGYDFSTASMSSSPR